MSLHGTIMVNGRLIAAWAAQRIETGDPNVYKCQVETEESWNTGPIATFQIEHRGEDGAVALAAKVLSHPGVEK